MQRPSWMQWEKQRLSTKVLIVLTMVLPLTSCVSDLGYCQLASRIGVEEGDVLTDKTARRILKNDLTYDELCL